MLQFDHLGRGWSDRPDSNYDTDFYDWELLALLDALSIKEPVGLVGLSMGGFATLHFGFEYPDRALSLTVAGCGYGADADKRDQFKKESEATSARIQAEGMEVVGKVYAIGPTRVQFQAKDPRGWKEFETQLCEHSTLGSANTMRGVQSRRPSLYDLTDKMRALTVPTLILNGDEDEPCLDVGNYMKRNIPSAALAVLPKTGHTLNLEEPDKFNAVVEDFIHTVECGRWTLRDPRSVGGGIITPKET